MTLKQKYEAEKALIIQDAEQIRNATTYTSEYLKHGSGCDSSDRAKIRMSFVKEAEMEFIGKHRKDILARAADMCLTQIGED